LSQENRIMMETAINAESFVNGIIVTHFVIHSKGMRYSKIVDEAKLSGRSERTIKRVISNLEAKGIITRVVDTSTKPATVIYEPNTVYAREMVKIMKKDLFLQRFWKMSEWFRGLEVEEEGKIEILTHILRNMLLLTSKWPALAMQWAIEEEDKEEFIQAFIWRWNGDLLYRMMAIVQLCWENKDLAKKALNKALNWMDKDLKFLGEEAVKGKKSIIDFSKTS
jgi:predicted transcriptional regulator